MNTTELRLFHRQIDEAFNNKAMNFPPDEKFERKIGDLTEEEIDQIVSAFRNEIYEYKDKLIFGCIGRYYNSVLSISIHPAAILYGNDYDDEIRNYKNFLEKEHDRILDLLYGKPTPEDIEKIQNYIESNRHEMKCA